MTLLIARSVTVYTPLVPTAKLANKVNATVLALPLCPGKISSVISVGKYRFDKQLRPAGKCQHISQQIAVDKRKSVKKASIVCSTTWTEQWKSFIMS